MALSFTFQTTCHQRALGRVETGNGAAGNGDEHKTPYRCALGMHVIKVVPDFRNLIFRMGEDADAHTDCHDNQTDAEKRIYLPDDFIDGNKGCNKIICQNDKGPHFYIGEHSTAAGIPDQGGNQTGRPYSKYGSNHDKKYYAENAHNVFHNAAHVDSCYFGNGDTLIACAEHA